jgi:CBS domain containing-hemolysin-like protein
MSEIPGRSEQSDSEHRNVPMTAAEASDKAQETNGESWFAHMMRILFGLKAAATRADLALVLETGSSESGFSPEESAMLRNILGLRDRRIEQVMVPRADIVAVQKDIALGALVKVFEGAAHSRLVVYDDTLDDPVGMVHIRDLIAFMTARAAVGPLPETQAEKSPSAELDLGKIDLSTPLSATRIVRDILYAPPSMPALDLLVKMQATRIHLALVIDEYGGTDGLVSLEDVVELIVGDISDEHDEDVLPAVTRQSDGTFLANGRASLDDMRAVIGAEFDVGEVAEEVDTLGGYLVTKAGHVPVRGELVPGPNSFESEVLDADPRRVKKVRIYRTKDRRPALPREPVAIATTPATASLPREESSRTNPNSPRQP